MEVYIEYVFIDNLIIDYLLIIASGKTARVKVKKWRAVFSSLLGSVSAIIFPLFEMPILISLLSKACLGLLMVLVAVSCKRVREYLRAFLFFMLFTFLFGGAIIGLFYLLKIDYIEYFKRENGFIPIGVTILLVYILSKCCISAITRLLQERDIKPFVRTCAVIIDNRKFSVRGFVDSGNRLFDSMTGLPIIVASRKFATLLAREGLLMPVNRYINFDTVGGLSRMRIYKIDNLVIYNGEVENIFNNVLMGIAVDDFTADGDYELLLHPSLV